MAPIEQADKWADFGLSGLVIFALFCFVYFIVSQHSNERKEIHDQHSAERREWLIAFKTQSENMIEVAKESNEVTRALTAAVERQNGRRRSSDFDFEQHR